jgi:hypothetical protein
MVWRLPSPFPSAQPIIDETKLRAPALVRSDIAWEFYCLQRRAHVRPVLVFGLLLLAAPVEARPAKTAILDLEILDMSQQAGDRVIAAEQSRRLALATAELRKLLASSDEIAPLDTAPQEALIQDKSPVFKCNGCIEDIGKALGAELVVSGYIQKTSNLILSFVLTVTDVATGKVVRGAQVDIRGNTDDTWLRGIRWMVKNRLLAEPLPGRS